MNGGDGAENEERVFSMLRLVGSVGTNILKHTRQVGVKTPLVDLQYRAPLTSNETRIR